MSSFGFDEMKREFEQLKRDFPPVAGNIAVRYFVKSFDDQSWDGQAWDDVKRRNDTTSAAYKYPKTKDLGRHNRPILIGKSEKKEGSTQHLRAAVNSSLESASFEAIDFKVPGEYPQVHNEGLRSGRGNGFTMKKRQFIGVSETLIKQITDAFEKYMGKYPGLRGFVK